MTKLNELKKNLRPGRVYRRQDLEQYSNAVDRHLKQLLAEGTLTKLSGGLYHCPKKTAFGEAPADDKTLVEAFLKDKRFLVSSPNAYNALGVGTTQLYNETVVYNHKRHGRENLGGRVFDFRSKPHFPKALSEEFLLVDLVNNVDRLAEDREELLGRVKTRAAEMDQRALAKAVSNYGSGRAKRFFSVALSGKESTHAA